VAAAKTAAAPVAVAAAPVTAPPVAVAAPAVAVQATAAAVVTAEAPAAPVVESASAVAYAGQVSAEPLRVEGAVGPSACCSPRHRMAFSSTFQDRPVLVYRSPR